METIFYYLFGIVILLNLLILTNIVTRTKFNQNDSSTDSKFLRFEAKLNELMAKTQLTQPVRDAHRVESYSRDVNNAPPFVVKPNVCNKQTLYGEAHHGGWNICSDMLPVKDNSVSGPCLVYSYGLGADWSFDNALEKVDCEIHGFDPSGKNWRDSMHGAPYSGINYAQQYPSSRKHFHNWGLGAAEIATYPAKSIPQDWPGLGDPQLSSTNSEPWEVRSLYRTFVDLGHASGTTTISILKIDVEGAEWDALAAFLYDAVAVKMVLNGFIQQFLIEWHWDPDSRAKNQRHAAIMNRLEDLGFVPWQVTRHEGSDCCLDISYIWKKAAVKSSS